MVDWRDILAEHGSAVWRAVYRLLNDYADASDCYQETFVAAWEYARREGVEVAKWRGLLLSIGTRKAMDLLRRRYREKRVEGIGELASTGASPEQNIKAEELMERVRGCLTRMPDGLAQTFWLCCIEGLTHEEVGRQMGVSEGAARVNLHRARERLAKELEEGGLENRDLR